MKRDKTPAPSPGSESEQLASLRTRQERHERLAREHAASAKRVWLRRVLLELSQEKNEAEEAVKTKAKARGKKKSKVGVKKKTGAGMKKTAGPRRRRRANEACAASDPATGPRR